MASSTGPMVASTKASIRTASRMDKESKRGLMAVNTRATIRTINKKVMEHIIGRMGANMKASMRTESDMARVSSLIQTGIQKEAVG